MEEVREALNVARSAPPSAARTLTPGCNREADPSALILDTHGKVPVTLASVQELGNTLANILVSLKYFSKSELRHLAY